MTALDVPETVRDKIQLHFNCRELDPARTRQLAEQLLDGAPASGENRGHSVLLQPEK